MVKPYKKFVFAVDFHYGFERKNGHKVPMHDAQAIATMLAFTKDFQPDVFVIGGDGLDCSVISHHNRGKPGRTEGFKLLADAQGFAASVIAPINEIKSITERVYIKGNHEIWIDDLVDENPGLEGVVSLEKLLPLDNWKIIEQGGHYKLGRLVMCHGDQVGGGDNHAKSAAIAYEKSVIYGHHHCHSAYTKNTPFDSSYPHTAISVPCLCKRAPAYGKNKPNKWSSGYLFGYVLPNGNFHHYVVTIIDGHAVVNGKYY